MNTFTRGIGVIAAAVVVTTGGAAVASAAPESPAGIEWSNCKSGQWCMWDAINGSGTGYVAYDSPADDNLAVPDQGWNDRADSVWNRTPRVICVYWDKDFGGSYIRIPANSAQTNLPVSWRNKVSSYRTIPNGVSSCVYE